jgi:hypothetical protein
LDERLFTDLFLAEDFFLDERFLDERLFTDLFLAEDFFLDERLLDERLFTDLFLAEDFFLDERLLDERFFIGEDFFGADLLRLGDFIFLEPDFLAPPNKLLTKFSIIFIYTINKYFFFI